MKTNETPEKIYMTPSFGEPDNVLLASFSKSHLNFHRDIEYTRTDAFIDKACEWINLHIGELSDIYTRSAIRNEFLEDFRKAMEE